MQVTRTLPSTTTSGLVVPEMGVLTLAELCKGAHLLQRVLRQALGATFGHSHTAGIENDL